jgi:hypothetical protein
MIYNIDIQHIETVHGKRFPRPSLPICEDSSVVSLQGGVYHGSRRRLVHFLLCAVLVIDIVKHERMRGKCSSSSGLDVAILCAL